MNEHNGHVRKLIDSRGNLIEIAVLAVVLALAVNLISSAISDYLGPTRIRITLSVGVTLVSLSAVYLAVRLLRTRKATISLEGVYLVDKGHNLISIPLYEYSEDLKRYFSSAFAENKALRAAWCDTRNVDEDSDTPHRIPKASKLLNEATEYFLLHEFSLHLSSYFNGHDHSERLVEISRNDIPTVLLSNRFLELFSKPMEDRPAFCDSIRDLPPGSKVVAQFSSEGMFSEFDLTLPKKSKVTRTAAGDIQIETPRFVMKLRADATPWGYVLPRGVEEFVLQGETLDRISSRSVKIQIDVTFKFGALLTPTGWEDYRWLDSFERELREKFSIDDFFERHNWRIAQTMLLMVGARKTVGFTRPSGRRRADRGREEDVKPS